jgi:hypothetical protein
LPALGIKQRAVWAQSPPNLQGEIMQTDWSVYKTGAYMFDQLHACGLGILLACLTGQPVNLVDEGAAYRLKTAVAPPATLPDDLWQRLFSLPANANLEEVEQLSLSVFDGLLAALFTTKGVRLVSTADAIWNAKYRPTAITEGLDKVNGAVTRWQTFVLRHTRSQTDWVAALLPAYDPEKRPSYHPAPVSRKGLAVLMTLDPTFSYASRQPVSDHLLDKKCNVGFAQMPFAPLLAYIGAARFLRAQRTKGNFVNFYTPLFQQMDISCDVNLAMLKASVNNSRQTLLHHWLSGFLHTQHAMTGLAYQFLQTQGAQQSISVMRGCLDYQWLRGIGSFEIMGKWRSLLSKRVEESPLELDLLEEALLLPKQPDRWRHHWTDWALQVLMKKGDKLTLAYHISTMKEISMNMTPNSMSCILSKDKGTIRFGQALRQLGRDNLVELRDRIDELLTIQTQNQLLQTLAKANEACLIAKARNVFIIIPDDDDLAILLDDVDQFGAAEIASLLIILAMVAYPRRKSEEDEATVASEQIEALKGGASDE